MSRPRIVISCGDVNGIGIECLAGALQLARNEGPTLGGQPSSPLPADLALCIDADVFADVLAKHHIAPFEIELIPIHAHATVQPGVCASDAGALAIASLNKALECVGHGGSHAHDNESGYGSERGSAAASSKRADAIVTLPISKDACRQAGWPYPGHTEVLAERARGEALMLLCDKQVRVGLVTAHVPLRYVAATITQARVEERLQAMHRALTRDFAIAAPRVAVLGLNPHAGEEGLIGTEEQTVLRPAIAAANSNGIHAEGPFPSDGFFAFGAYKNYDGILAMYHDQGLIPLKLLAHGGGVNVTANLELVRTSPDHGTAFGIAGRNAADPASTLAALTMAIEIVNSRKALI